MLADDRDERLLHRLEAFSDIVIGFSLAQSALSLSILQDLDGFARPNPHLKVYPPHDTGGKGSPLTVA